MRLPYSRALVTGATGFIGKRLTETLLEAGVRVHCLSSDITDEVALKGEVAAVAPEAIFHLAAYGTFGHEKDVSRMIDVNVRGTYYLLSAAKDSGCKTLVFAASAKEYAPSRVPITEEVPLAPWDDYAVTKAAATYFCRLAAEKLELMVSVLRLSPVYGPGDSPNRFVLTAVRAALEGTPFTISVSSLVRNFTFIDDVVEAFLLASARTGETYEEFNIAANKAHSFEEVLVAIEQACGKKISRIVTSYPGKGDDSWILDNSKAKRILGWEPRVSLTEGIRQAVKDFMATPGDQHR